MFQGLNSQCPRCCLQSHPQLINNYHQYPLKILEVNEKVFSFRGMDHHKKDGFLLLHKDWVPGEGLNNNNLNSVMVSFLLCQAFNTLKVNNSFKDQDKCYREATQVNISKTLHRIT
jgi:hypothetical protein